MQILWIIESTDEWETAEECWKEAIGHRKELYVLPKLRQQCEMLRQNPHQSTLLRSVL